MSKGQHDKSSVAGHPTTSAGDEWKSAAFAFAETFLSGGSYNWTPKEWLAAVQARASHQAPQAAEAPVAAHPAPAAQARPWTVDGFKFPPLLIDLRLRENEVAILGTDGRNHVYVVTPSGKWIPNGDVLEDRAAPQPASQREDAPQPVLELCDGPGTPASMRLVWHTDPDMLPEGTKLCASPVPAAHPEPAGCPECGFTGDRDLPTKVDALELENVRLSEERDHLLKWLETGLTFGKNKRAGDEREHIEWHAKCGCAFHPEPFPHVHPCSEEHRRPDLHAHPAPPTAPLSVEQITAMLPKTTDGTTTCPLCGKADAHQHTPAEIIIFKNGVTRGFFMR